MGIEKPGKPYKRGKTGIYGESPKTIFTWQIPMDTVNPALKVKKSPLISRHDQDRYGATLEEVAAALSLDEDRLVTINEVRIIECQALRKIRSALARMGLRPSDLFDRDA